MNERVMHWPSVIEKIMQSDTKAPDGNKWTYQRIGKEVGLSKTSIGKLYSGDIPDPRFTEGTKLVELYLKITKPTGDNDGSAATA